jgi:hypothetical protein
MPGTFYSLREQALMRGADSADSPRQYLSPFGDKMIEKLCVFEINIGNFFRAELAYSFAPNTESFRTWHRSWPFYH